MAISPCSSCGQLLRAGARFCGTCGAVQSGAPPPVVGPTQRMPSVQPGAPPPVVGPTQRMPSAQPMPAPSYTPVGQQTPTPPLAGSTVRAAPHRASHLANLGVSQKAIVATLAGFLGGAVAAALLSLLNVRFGLYSQVALALIIGVVVGALVPASINAVPGLLAGQARRAQRNAGLAAGVGVAVMTLVSLGLAGVVPREAIFFQGNFLLGLLAWLLYVGTLRRPLPPDAAAPDRAGADQRCPGARNDTITIG